MSMIQQIGVLNFELHAIWGPKKNKRSRTHQAMELKSDLVNP